MLQKILKLYGHKFICGMTRSGKTYLAIELMKGWRGPVLFFNPQYEKTGPGFIEAGRWSSVKAFHNALRAGKRINYVPSDDQKQAEKELAALVNFLSTRWRGSNLLFAADECQDFAQQGKSSPLLFVARRGLRREIHGLFIAQRPADVHNVLLSQSLQHIIFQINSYDRQYFTNYRMPGELIDEKLRKGGQYSFVMWDNRELTGPFRI